MTAIRYRIVPFDLNAHLFEVRCTVEAPDPAGQRFRLPTWIPGSYLIREFARQFVDVRAEAAGAPLPIVKVAKDAWRAAFEGFDALVCPSLPNVAAKSGQEAFELPDGTSEPVINAYVRLSCPADITGLPAMSVPCGFNSEGLPIGLQIIGRPFDEPTVLRVGQAYESATNWTQQSPKAPA